MKKTLSCLFFFALFLVSFSQNCQDFSLIDPLVFCPTVIEPVCGCDGNTYNNSCEAESFFGISTWTQGACGQQSCFVDIFPPGAPELCSGDSLQLLAISNSTMFQWSTGESGPFIWVYSPGIYTVEAFDPNGCVAVFTIDILPGLNCNPSSCIDPNQIDSLIMCPLVFDPVCGCDGVTYNNSCEAENWFGITTWTQGACGSQNCFVDILPLGPPELCSGDSLELLATSNSTTFQWSTGETGPSILIFSPGVYSVETIDNNGCVAVFTIDILPGLNCNPSSCIDPNQIDSMVICPTVFAPVCGCDGVTYNNSCEAENWFGVTTWTQGACGQQNCFVDILPMGPLDLCSGDSLELMAISNSTMFQWSTGETGPSIWVYSPGLYMVEAFDPNGCVSVFTIDILPGFNCNNTACIDSSIIDPNMGCFTLYDPVCGCDGITYNNSCEAEYWNGITTWTQGACGQQNCIVDILPLGPPELCAGDSLELLATSNSTMFQWSTGETSPSIWISSPGIYTVEAFDPNGCVAVFTIDILPGLNCNPSTCIDPNQIDSMMICPTVYSPVCGCDGITYSNSCEAENWFGVTTWTQGACGQQNCFVDILPVGPPEVCPGDSLELIATSNSTMFQWSTGETSPSIWISSPGIYTVEAFDPNGCIAVFTIDILPGLNCNPSSCIDPTQIDSVVICPTVNAPVCGCDGNTYNNSCEAENWFGVTTWTQGACGQQNCFVDILPIGPPELCPGDSLELLAASNASMFQWSTGESGPSIWVYSPGIYTVEAFDPNGCVAVFTIDILAGVNCTPSSCIDPSQIDPLVICPTVIAPVCGCDGVTYNNSCEAENWFGVTSWTSGACSPQNCQVSVFSHGPPYICPGDLLVLEASHGFMNYQWSSGNQGQILDVFQPGIYTVTAEDSIGCISTFTFEVYIHSSCAPTICIDSNQINPNIPCPLAFVPVCGCDGVTYDNSCYAENYGGVTSFIPGICSADLCTVSISPAGPLYICPGDSILLTAIGTGLLEWNTGEIGPELWVYSAGTYTVTLMDSTGCISISDIQIFGSTNCNPGNCIDSSIIDSTVICFNPIDTVCGCDGVTYPTPCHAEFGAGVTSWVPGPCNGGCSVQIGPLTPQLCQGSTMLLWASPGHDSYIWSTGETTQDIVIQSGGTYSVTVTDSSSCTASAVVDVIGGVASPVDIDMVSGSSNMQFCPGEPIILHANYSGNVIWSNGLTGNPITIVLFQNDTITATPIGNSCLLPTTFHVELDSCGTGNLPDSENGIKVYPNPFKNEIVVDFSKLPGKSIELVIYDLLGKVYFRMDETPNQLEKINSEDFPSGVYLIEIKSIDTIFHQKILKN